MNYKVDTTGNFEKEAKRLIKKYKSLKIEIAELINELEENPFKGTLLGNGVYKIRLKVKSTGKGKSGGARVMTYVQIVDEKVVMFSIYTKSEKDTITDKKIKQLIKNIK